MPHIKGRYINDNDYVKSLRRAVGDVGNLTDKDIVRSGVKGSLPGGLARVGITKMRKGTRTEEGGKKFGRRVRRETLERGEERKRRGY